MSSGKPSVNRSKTALRRGRAFIPPPGSPQPAASAEEQHFLLGAVDVDVGNAASQGGNTSAPERGEQA